MHAVCHALQGLEPAAASLLLRLFQRRGPWFRAGTLSYAEVPDVPATLSTLCTAGMAQMVYEDGGTRIFSAASTGHAAAAVDAGAAAGGAVSAAAGVGGKAESEQAIAPSSCGASKDDDYWVVEADGDAAGQAARCAAAAPPISWQQLAELLTVPELGAVLIGAWGLGGGRGAAGGAAASRAAATGTRAQVLEALRALVAKDEAGARLALLQATGAFNS